MCLGCDKNVSQGIIWPKNHMHPRNRRQGDKDGGQVKTWGKIETMKV